MDSGYCRGLRRLGGSRTMSAYVMVSTRTDGFVTQSVATRTGEVDWVALGVT